MKRPNTCTPRRPTTGTGRSAKTAKEAAIHLVRVEFDVNRLTMGIEQARERIRIYNEELGQKLRDRDFLLGLIKD